MSAIWGGTAKPMPPAATLAHFVRNRIQAATAKAPPDTRHDAEPLAQHRDYPIAPTATGVASPSVCRVNKNDTAAPTSDSAPASTNADEKLPVICTI